MLIFFCIPPGCRNFSGEAEDFDVRTRPPFYYEPPRRRPENGRKKAAAASLPQIAGRLIT
jgi:hypothetical protein